MTDEDRNSSEQGSGQQQAAAEPVSTEPGNGEAGGAETDGAETAGAQRELASAASRRGGGPSRGLLLTATFALLVAIAAAALTGVSWWQYRQLSGAQHAADAHTGDALQKLQASLSSLADKLDGFEQHLQQSDKRIDDLDQRWQPIPGRLAQLQEQLDALQGGTQDVRATWLRDEARYYLRIANAQLQLAHDWRGAIDALNLADGRLRELADPGLAPVRRLIAQEIDALKAVDLPDIDGLAARLEALEGRAGELPLRAETPASFSGHAAPIEQTEPGLSRFWAAIKRALSGMVHIQRRGRPVRQALTDEQRALIRRQLAVRLQLAEVAAVRRRPAAFRASIEAAHRLLDDDFDSSDAAVADTKRALMQMGSLDIAPSPPDISQSLVRLRAAGGGI